MHFNPLLAGLSALSCTVLACQPPSIPSPPVSPSPTPAQSSTPVSSASPKPVDSPTPAATPAPQATLNPIVAVASDKPVQDLSVVKSLGISASKIYLDTKGEVLTLQPILKDAQGQLLNTTDFPLEWLSSRPGDFNIEPSGKVTALVEYGFSEITLRIPGTDLAAKQLLSVTEIVGTSSSGSASKPTREQVSGSVKFEF